MARFQIALALLGLVCGSDTTLHRLNLIQPIPRNATDARVQDQAPCGNSAKGPAHLLAEPGSLNPVIWSVNDFAEDGRCLVSLATEPEVIHKVTLHPNDGSGDALGWFECGRESTNAERKVFTLPSNTVCDACTLQLIYTDINSTEFTCVDLQISNEFGEF